MYVVIIPPGLLGDSQSTTSVRNIPPVVTITFNGSDGTNQNSTLRKHINTITHLHDGVVNDNDAASPGSTVTALILTV